MIKKGLQIVLFFIGSVNAFAQSVNKELMTLVNAEKRFSADSKSKGINTAFLESFAPDVIYFDHEGNKVVYAEHASKQPRPEGNPTLIWEPYYADISSSGDFGYTTGPFFFFKDKADTVPIGYGYYSSVWKKDKQGVWKVAMDLGIGIPGKPTENSTFKTSAQPLERKKAKKNEILPSLMAIENSYCAKLNLSTHSYDTSHLSKEIRIHRPGRYPFIGIEAVVTVPESDKAYQYTVLDGQLSKSGDMGFAYGKVNVKIKRDSGIQDVKAVYYRIWKKEKGKEWKVVLDVIGFT